MLEYYGCQIFGSTTSLFQLNNYLFEFLPQGNKDHKLQPPQTMGQLNQSSLYVKWQRAAPVIAKCHFYHSWFAHFYHILSQYRSVCWAPCTLHLELPLERQPGRGLVCASLYSFPIILLSLSLHKASGGLYCCPHTHPLQLSAGASDTESKVRTLDHKGKERGEHGPFWFFKRTRINHMNHRRDCVTSQ